MFNGRGFFYDTKTRRKIDPTLSDDTIRAALVFAEDLAKKSGHVLKLNAPEKKLLDSTFESAEEAGSKKNLPVTKKSP